MAPAPTPRDAPSSLDASFRQQAVELLRGTYVPRLERALEVLPPGDLWWPPHAGALSVGQVLRHLEGNVRQWILSGLDGRPDARRRAAEFEGPDPRGAGELLAALRATVEEACAVIAGLDAATLAAPRTVQGFATTGLGAVLHVVEHASWHTGQAVWIAKARGGREHGIAFYDDEALEDARNRSRDD